MKSQSIPPASPKLLDGVRQGLRRHHYSIHTERGYLDWVRRQVHFHRMQCREDLAGGEAFLTPVRPGQGRP